MSSSKEKTSKIYMKNRWVTCSFNSSQNSSKNAIIIFLSSTFLPRPRVFTFTIPNIISCSAPAELRSSRSGFNILKKIVCIFAFALRMFPIPFPQTLKKDENVKYYLLLQQLLFVALLLLYINRILLLEVLFFWLFYAFDIGLFKKWLYGDDDLFSRTCEQNPT